MFKFHALSTVADPEATIRAIANERGKSTRKRVRHTSKCVVTAGEGGLLSTSLLREDGESEQSSNVARRHFTQVYHRKPKSVYAETDHVSVYKLEFLSQQCLGSCNTVNEPISFLLSFRCETIIVINAIISNII